LDEVWIFQRRTEPIVQFLLLWHLVDLMNEVSSLQRKGIAENLHPLFYWVGSSHEQSSINGFWKHSFYSLPFVVQLLHIV